jgi:hypothetical protein
MLNRGCRLPMKLSSPDEIIFFGNELNENRLWHAISFSAKSAIMAVALATLGVPAIAGAFKKRW